MCCVVSSNCVICTAQLLSKWFMCLVIFKKKIKKKNRDVHHHYRDDVWRRGAATRPLASASQNNELSKQVRTRKFKRVCFSRNVGDSSDIFASGIFHAGLSAVGNNRKEIIIKSWLPQVKTARREESPLERLPNLLRPRRSIRDNLLEMCAKLYLHLCLDRSAYFRL